MRRAPLYEGNQFISVSNALSTLCTLLRSHWLSLQPSDKYFGRCAGRLHGAVVRAHSSRRRVVVVHCLTTINHVISSKIRLLLLQALVPAAGTCSFLSVIALASERTENETSGARSFVPELRIA